MRHVGGHAFIRLEKVLARGIGHGRILGGKESVEGPDQPAAVDRRQFGAQAEFERPVGAENREIDQQHRLRGKLAAQGREQIRRQRRCGGKGLGPKTPPAVLPGQRNHLEALALLQRRHDDRVELRHRLDGRHVSAPDGQNDDAPHPAEAGLTDMIGRSEKRTDARRIVRTRMHAPGEKAREQGPDRQCGPGIGANPRAAHQAGPRQAMSRFIGFHQLEFDWATIALMADCCSLRFD